MILKIAPAFTTGVIPRLASSCLVLRDIMTDKTCSNSNYFGSSRSIISGGYMFCQTKYPPSRSINFAVIFQIFCDFFEF